VGVFNSLYGVLCVLVSRQRKSGHFGDLFLCGSLLLAFIIVFIGLFCVA